jgi:hypothetical protein
MMNRRRIWAAVLLAVLCVSACTSDSARYEERIVRLRSEVRGSFPPRFDPIWIAKEKKAAEAQKELVTALKECGAALRLDGEAIDACFHNIRQVAARDGLASTPTVIVESRGGKKAGN